MLFVVLMLIIALFLMGSLYIGMQTARRGIPVYQNTPHAPARALRPPMRTPRMPGRYR